MASCEVGPLGAKVVLLHGWGGTYDSTYRAVGWEAVLEEYGLQAIGIDLPGHKRSGSSYDPADYADLAALVSPQIPPEVEYCIAFSLGAKVALEIELRSPGRFKRMVVGGVGDNIFAPEVVGRSLVDALLGEVQHEAPPIVRELMQYIAKGGADPRSLAAVVRRPHNPQHSEARLSLLEAPVLLVNGSEDKAALPDDRFRAALPNLTRVVLDNCGHVDLTEDRRFMQLAAQFLNKEAGRELHDRERLG